MEKESQCFLVFLIQGGSIFYCILGQDSNEWNTQAVMFCPTVVWPLVFDTLTLPLAWFSSKYMSHVLCQSWSTVLSAAQWTSKLYRHFKIRLYLCKSGNCCLYALIKLSDYLIKHFCLCTLFNSEVLLKILFPLNS